MNARVDQEFGFSMEINGLNTHFAYIDQRGKLTINLFTSAQIIDISTQLFVYCLNVNISSNR